MKTLRALAPMENPPNGNASRHKNASRSLPFSVKAHPGQII